MSNPFFDHPILNSPYECPTRHWELDDQGQPTQRTIENRRPAEFITPIPKPRKRKIYVLAGKRNGTIYIGVTSDFCKRVWEHTNDVVEGLTRKCGVHSLVYDELHKDMSRSSDLRGQ